jgi:germination protein M
MFRKIYVWITLLLLTLLVAGCDAPVSQDTNSLPVTGAELQGSLLPNSTANQTSNNDHTAQDMMKIKTYQATKDAMYLVPEIHIVPKNTQPAQTALELLIAGPSNTELVAVVPPGSKVLSVNVKNHIAYADFNDKLIKNSPGGSTDEILLVAAIVDTLTEFPEIQKVQILVNGKKIDTITGHMDTSEPLNRSEKIIKE